MIAFVLAAGCDHYPRDMADTSARVEADKLVRVGLIAGRYPDGDLAAARRYIGRVAKSAGATPRITIGAQEPLLVDLEDGNLDLVLGELDAKSPWIDRVAILEPLTEHDGTGLHPIARNGENSWIMRLERTARDSGSAS